MGGKIQTNYSFCTPIYFLTSTEFFLPSQNSNFGTKSQALYKISCNYFINLMKKWKNYDILKFVS